MLQSFACFQSNGAAILGTLTPKSGVRLGLGLLRFSNANEHAGRYIWASKAQPIHNPTINYHIHIDVRSHYQVLYGGSREPTNKMVLVAEGSVHEGRIAPNIDGPEAYPKTGLQPWRASLGLWSQVRIMQECTYNSYEV